MKKIIVTTSWDDGDKLDLKLANLLGKYGLHGTFYISPRGKKFSLLAGELKQLSQSQEIGAHTISHPDLTKLKSFEAKKEILDSKNYLEDLLKKPVKMFCYPFGKFNQEIKDLVKEAGFLGARTVENFKIHSPDDFFEFGTSLQIYTSRGFFNWLVFAKCLFSRVLKEGEIYHLWGHSWEIEKYQMWQELEGVLKYIAKRKDVLYLTNSQALETLL